MHKKHWQLGRNGVLLLMKNAQTNTSEMEIALEAT